MNKNRIVRVRNEKINDMLSYVARLSRTPYQHVFEEFLDYVEEGHVIGEYSHMVLLERVLEGLAD